MNLTDFNPNNYFMDVDFMSDIIRFIRYVDTLKLVDDEVVVDLKVFLKIYNNCVLRVPHEILHNLFDELIDQKAAEEEYEVAHFLQQIKNQSGGFDFIHHIENDTED